MIDELEDALAEGRRVFFSGRLLVDEERILDIIDRMRVAVPEELKQARRVISEQERLIGEAQSHVRQVLEEQGLLAAVEAERVRLLDLADTGRSGAALDQAGSERAERSARAAASRRRRRALTLSPPPLASNVCRAIVRREA